MDDLAFFLLSQLDFLMAADVAGTPVELVEVQAPHRFVGEPGFEDLTVDTLEAPLGFLGSELAAADRRRRRASGRGGRAWVARGSRTVA